MVSLGYTEGQAGYGASLKTVKVGKLDLGALDSLGAALTKAASGVDNVICHELFVTQDGPVNAVFLVLG